MTTVAEVLHTLQGHEQYMSMRNYKVTVLHDNYQVCHPSCYLKKRWLSEHAFIIH